MTASYPASIKQFTRKRDLLDIVLAADINQVYDEVTSIEQKLGTLPGTNLGYDQGTFDVNTLVWPSVRDRVQNIEYGLIEAYNNRVGSNGGSTIIPSGPSIKGLVIKAAASQTASLLEIKNALDVATLVADSTGTVLVNNSEVATIGGTQTLQNKTISGISNSLSDIPATSVIITEGSNIRSYVDSRPTVIYQDEQPLNAIPGTIWIDSGDDVDPFDASQLLLKNDPSAATTEEGFRRIFTSGNAPTASDGSDGDMWLQFIP